MLEIFQISCIITLVMIVWFNTSAIPEYLRFFKLGKFFLADEYFAAKSKDEGLHYGLFLFQQFPCMVTKLAACWVCVSVWLSLLVSIATNLIGYYSIINIVSILLYLVVSRLS